ncbi:MAG: response regulator [Synechococcales cyanobacterium CRU_2_2]|nr:response regulator [Synechococcales cyanobacterium CRU_2_2]
MRFLVVDDSSVDRHLMTSLLEDMGHQVEVFQSTEGVLDKMKSSDYAAVILDIVMPEQDGYKFLRELRLNPSTKQQYVIFCSSKKTPIEIDYGIKRAGANDYIPKPVTRSTLEAALQKV